MIQCQSGPGVMRLPKKSYDIEAKEAARMEAAGICTFE